MKLLHVISTIVSLAIGTSLVACETGPFSGSGSMRIEVEVYKGPLSQEPEMQWGELVGYVEEAKRAIVEVSNFTLGVVANRGFKTLRKDRLSILDITQDHDLNPSIVASGQPIITGSASPHSLRGTVSPKQLAPMFLYRPADSTPPNEAASAFKVSWCDTLDATGFFSQHYFYDCLILRGIYVDSLDLIREVNMFLSRHGANLHNPNISQAEAKSALAQIAELSSEFRAKGFRWAVATTAGQSFNLPVRIAVHDFVVVASEYGNQLQARADTLLKQRDGGKLDRRELSLSSYLRDSEPTDFVHLYDWLGTSTDSFRYKLPDFLLTGHWPLGVGERVKVVDRLFADHYWSKINTVYASGKGKVSLAFVKDEIGNWDLKNMDNAPGELLKAYTDFATAVARKGTQIATSYFTGGTPQALSLARDFLTAARSTESQLQETRSVDQEAIAHVNILQKKAGLAMKNIWDDRRSEDALLKKQYEDSKDSPEENSNLSKLLSHRRDTFQQLERVVKEYRDEVEITRDARQPVSSKAPGTVLNTEVLKK